MAPSIMHRAFHKHQNSSGVDRMYSHKTNSSRDQSIAADSGYSSSRTPSTSISQPPPNHTTTVLIGPKKQRFKVNKKQLCAVSSFFRDRLEDPSQPRAISLWLPAESPSMFALFVEWLQDRYSFRMCLDETATQAQEAGQKPMQELHWALIRLHLFASHLSIFHLQDTAMDVIQDLYLKCDWDVSPSLISYLYTKCEALPSVRLRRWVVAMVAFSLTGSSSNASPVKYHPQDSQTSDMDQIHGLLESLPEFATDHAIHIQKMDDSGLDVRFKNPQLRIPANKLRNDERAFGFRECSFHSHRATVGERRCPHERKRLLRAANANVDGLVELPATRVDRLDLAELPSGPMGDSRSRSRAGEDEPIPGLSDKTRQEEEELKEKALKHMRSISSTMR